MTKRIFLLLGTIFFLSGIAFGEEGLRSTRTYEKHEPAEKKEEFQENLLDEVMSREQVAAEEQSGEDVYNLADREGLQRIKEENRAAKIEDEAEAKYNVIEQEYKQNGDWHRR